MLRCDLATVTGRPEHYGGVFRCVDVLGGDGWRSFEIWHGNDPKKRSYQYSLFTCNPDIMPFGFYGLCFTQKNWSRFQSKLSWCFFVWVNFSFSGRRVRFLLRCFIFAQDVHLLGVFTILESQKLLSNKIIPA